MEYRRDTSTFGLTIDNGTELSVNDVFPGNVDRMDIFLVSPSNEFHVDAGPEPTSAVLAILGLIGLGLVRRRRLVRR